MLTDAQRIVIKVGSALLMKGATPRGRWLAAMAEDIANLKKQGKDIVIVTSGAVGLGRAPLKLTGKALTLEQKQAAAACGQPQLMAYWAQALAAHQLTIGQMLLTADDSINRRRYLNARTTLETLLSYGVIPVINENDMLATHELRIGDNDRLSARVAEMASADCLIIFSDIDGLYTANPRTDPDAQFIPEIHGGITPEIEAMAGGTGSSHGTGGMVTKIAAAKIALHAGCNMVIARGDIAHPLRNLQNGGKASWFMAGLSPLSARKQWIAGSLHPAGSVVIDAGAERALKRGNSLLPAGATAIKGDFQRGDAVLIEMADGRIVGKGLCAYSSRASQLILGLKTSQIKQILGFKGRNALIHRDDLVLELY